MSNPRRDESAPDKESVPERSQGLKENSEQETPTLARADGVQEFGSAEQTPEATTQPSPKSDKIDRIGTVSLGKLIVEFAIPSIIGMVVNGSYNIISTVFLGLSLGASGLATVTVATPIMTMSLAMSLLVGAGGNALAAIKLGEGKRDTAERVMGSAFVLSICLALLSTLLTFLFMDPILMISGSTEGIQDSTRVFVGIIAVGFVFQYLGMAFNSFMRTAGNPRGALYVMIVGMGTSIALNYLFVMVNGWGVVGSGWATVIGMMVTTVGGLGYFVKSKTTPFRLRRRHILKPSSRLMVNICVLGSASFFLQAAAVVINLILNNQLVFYGALDPIGAEGALATVGVMSRIAMFAIFPILGVSIAIQPILGFNYGAKLYARVKKTFAISTVWVLAFGVLFWLLVHIFPVQIVGLFGVADGLSDFTVEAIQVMMLLMPFVGVQVLAAGYFQATDQPIKSMFVSMTRQLIFLIPLLLLLPLVVEQVVGGITPLQSLYYTYPIADVLSILTALVMMFFEWKRLGRMQKKQHDKTLEPSSAVNQAAVS